LKILRLHLTAFGPFTDCSLDLSGGKEGLHLVYGPNEAGKSTTLRALRALLFGIPRQSDDNHLHAYGDLRIGASLQIDAAGNGRAKRAEATSLELVRRKAVKSLYDGSDAAPLDESILKRALGGIEETTFQNRFGIDHEQLLAGGRAIDEGQGDLGELLFAASAGIAHLGRVHEELDTRAAALFKPRGQKLRLNMALDALAEQRKRVRELELSDSEWRRRQEAIAALQTSKQSATAALHQAEATRERLRRFALSIPLANQRAALQSAVGELGAVRALPADFAPRRQRAQQQASLAAQQLAKAAAEQTRIATQLAPLTASPAILAFADDLERLQSEVGSFTKAAADRVDLVAEQSPLERRIAALVATLGAGAGQSAAAVIPQLTLAARSRIEELAEQHPALVARRDALRQSLNDASRKLSEVQQELAGLPPATDCDALAKAMKRVQTAVPLAEGQSAKRLALQTASEQADIDAARLLGAPHTLADVERRSVPADAALDDAEQALGAARSALDHAAHRLGEATAQVEKLAAEQRRDAALVDAPAADALPAARARRNEAWRALRSALFADDLPQATTAAESLKLGIQEADDLADELLQTADQHVRRSAYQRQQAEAAELLARRTSEHDAARQAAAAAEANWQALWRPVGVAARSVREMRAWLAEFRRLCGEGARLRALAADLAHDQSRIDAAYDELQAALAPGLADQGDAGESLAELAARGEGRLNEAGQARQSRTACEKQISQLTRDRAAYDAQFQRAAADGDAWQAAWLAAIEPLGHATELSPKQAQAILRALDELHAIRATRDERAARIAGIDRDAAKLHAWLVQLVKEAASDLAPCGAKDAEFVSQQWVEATARELRRRATAARDAVQARTALAADLQRWQGELDDARRSAQAAESMLAALCQEAGAPNSDCLADLEARSAQHSALAERLHDLELRLTAEAAGAPLADFLVQLAQTDADAIAAEAAETSRRIEELQSERQRLHTEAALAERELAEKFGGDSAAADAAAEEASLRASIDDDVARFVQLKLASAVLRRSIDRYRQAHQAPLLARAGELFQLLTAGAFDRLDVDYDDLRPVIVGIRAGGKQRIRTTGMSAGTRDQLYLALRIASVEEYVAAHEPIPFIVDDVLQQFDDRRAVAALRTFAELSRKTQVIFFTHHEHLLRLAEEHLRPEVCFTQRLQATGAAATAR
jgi:uncharacterized protein YhaN